MGFYLLTLSVFFCSFVSYVFTASISMEPFPMELKKANKVTLNFQDNPLPEEFSFYIGVTELFRIRFIKNDKPKKKDMIDGVQVQIVNSSPTKFEFTLVPDENWHGKDFIVYKYAFDQDLLSRTNVRLFSNPTSLTIQLFKLDKQTKLDSRTLVEGQQVVLVCTVEGVFPPTAPYLTPDLFEPLPPPVFNMAKTEFQTVAMGAVTVDTNNKSAECRVRNLSQKMVFNVLYNVRFNNSELEFNSTGIAVCKAIGNPVPSVIMMINKTEILSGIAEVVEGETNAVRRLSEAKVGSFFNVTCKAEQIFPNGTKMVAYRNYTITVQIPENSMFGKEGNFTVVAMAGIAGAAAVVILVIVIIIVVIKRHNDNSQAKNSGDASAPGVDNQPLLELDAKSSPSSSVTNSNNNIIPPPKPPLDRHAHFDTRLGTPVSPVRFRKKPYAPKPPTQSLAQTLPQKSPALVLRQIERANNRKVTIGQEKPPVTELISTSLSSNPPKPPLDRSVATPPTAPHHVHFDASKEPSLSFVNSLTKSASPKQLKKSLQETKHSDPILGYVNRSTNRKVTIGQNGTGGGGQQPVEYAELTFSDIPGNRKPLHVANEPTTEYADIVGVLATKPRPKPGTYHAGPVDI